MTALQKKPTNPIAHLSAEDIEIIGKELDTIRQEVRDSLGEDDARYSGCQRWSSSTRMMP